MSQYPKKTPAEQPPVGSPKAKLYIPEYTERTQRDLTVYFDVTLYFCSIPNRKRYFGRSLPESPKVCNRSGARGRSRAALQLQLQLHATHGCVAAQRRAEPPASHRRAIKSTNILDILVLIDTKLSVDQLRIQRRNAVKEAFRSLLPENWFKLKN